jgi:hypothetical protein
MQSPSNAVHGIGSAAQVPAWQFQLIAIEPIRSVADRNDRSKALLRFLSFGSSPELSDVAEPEQHQLGIMPGLLGVC